MIARRIGAGVVLVLAAIGLLLCLAVIVVTWTARGRVNETVDTSIATLTGYLDHITADIQQVDAGLADAQTAVNDVAQRAQQGPVDPTVTANLTARLQSLDEFIARLQGGLDTVGGVVDAADRLPSVDADRLQGRLQSAADGLARVQSGINDVQTAIAQRDNPRIATVATNLSGAVGSARTQLADAQTNVNATHNSLTSAQERFPRWTFLGALAVTLLFALFGAGQVSLIARAWGWMRQPRQTTAVVTAASAQEDGGEAPDAASTG